ncbi:MAG: GumC family protein [Povalibacter sp.]
MPTQNSVAPQDASPDFGEYFGILRKRRRLLLLVALPIIAIGAAFAFLLPDVYRSEGNIEIEGAQASKNLIARTSKDDDPYADQYVQSLSTEVLSDEHLKQLLAKYKLYDDQTENPAAAIAKLRKDIKVDIVTATILDPETGRERNIVTSFNVAYESHDPQRAQQGAAWLVNAFMQENRRDREQEASSTAKFFAGEAQRMSRRVADLEGKLASFKTKNVGSLPELTGANLNAIDRTERDIQDIETQMQSLRRERVFLASQYSQARAANPNGGANLGQLQAEYDRKSSMYDPSHPDMVSLRRQIEMLKAGGNAGGSLKAQLQAQRSVLAEVRQRYSADHPDVRRIQRNIEALQARIASGETADAPTEVSPVAMQLQTQLNATDTQLSSLQARSMELRAKLNDLESRMNTAPEVEREFQAVTRDLDSARAKYEELLKRQMDAEVDEAAISGGTADKFTVKSLPGIPDEPAKPARLLLFVVSLIAAGVIALTTVFIAQVLDQTVRGARDIRDILDVAPLTTVPVIRRGSARHGTLFAR